jgi:hypothetical protein
MKLATQQVGIPHRYGTGWLVPSQSDPGTRYFVNADATRCSCRGYSFRGACVHLRIAAEAMRLIGEILDEEG